MSETIDLKDGVYRHLFTDGYKFGERLNFISLSAEACFTRLLCIMDARGVFPADARRVMLEAFPARRGDITEGQILDWMNELAAVGLIRRWKVGDKSFGVLIDAPPQPVGRNGRLPKSPFPDPPADLDDPTWIDGRDLDQYFKQHGKPHPDAPGCAGCTRMHPDAPDAPGRAGCTRMRLDAPDALGCAGSPKPRSGGHEYEYENEDEEKNDVDDDEYPGSPCAARARGGPPGETSSSSSPEFFDSGPEKPEGVSAGSPVVDQRPEIAGRIGDRHPPPTPTSPPPPPTPTPTSPQAHPHPHPPPTSGASGATESESDSESRRLDAVCERMRCEFRVIRKDLDRWRYAIAKGKPGWTVTRLEQALAYVVQAMRRTDDKAPKIDNPRAYLVTAVDQAWTPAPPPKPSTKTRREQEISDRMKRHAAGQTDRIRRQGEYTDIVAAKRREFFASLTDEEAARLVARARREDPESFRTWNLDNADPRTDAVLGQLVFDLVHETWIRGLRARMFPEDHGIQSGEGGEGGDRVRDGPLQLEEQASNESEVIEKFKYKAPEQIRNMIIDAVDAAR